MKVECPKYQALPGSRRCKHYLDNGGCSLPSELMCVEWERRNGHGPRPTSPKSPPVVQPPAKIVGRPTQVLAVRELKSEQIESLAQTGVELAIETPEVGVVWLVPEYTDQDRSEITFEHAATLAAFTSVFPGHRVMTFHRPKEQS